MHGLLIENHSNWFIGHLYSLAAIETEMKIWPVFLWFFFDWQIKKFKRWFMVNLNMFVHQKGWNNQL